MKVYSPGANVKLHAVEVVILQVCIKQGGYCHYEVAWWDGRSRETAWVEAHEITADVHTTPVKIIGFIS